MKNARDIVDKLPQKRRDKISARAEELIQQEISGIVRPVLKPAPYEPKQILIKKKKSNA